MIYTVQSASPRGNHLVSGTELCALVGARDFHAGQEVNLVGRRMTLLRRLPNRDIWEARQ